MCVLLDQPGLGSALSLLQWCVDHHLLVTCCFSDDCVSIEVVVKFLALAHVPRQNASARAQMRPEEE